MKRSIRSWLWRVPVDREIDEELDLHVEMRTRELMQRGMDRAAAREAAIQRMGDLGRLKQTCVDLGRKRDREMRIVQWLEELKDDVKYALRQLRRAPAFTLVAAITLALGIGANSAIFALVDATLLRPLPLPNSDRLLMVWERSSTSARGYVSPLNMLDWNERSRTVEKLAGFAPSVGGMVMSGADGTAETVPRQWVTAAFFDALGVTPVAGRTFSPSDDAQRSHVVVLNEPFWRSRFGGDPGVIGRVVQLDGAPYTIVGVVPKEAQLLGRTSIWAMRPIVRRPQLRTAYALQVIGRLKPGVSLDAAKSDMAAVADGLGREFPATNAGRGVTLEPAHDALIGSELRLTSMLFLGVVGFVLLICCANVANLLLARATVRARELAIRSALGAGRRRVIRQLLTESLVLSAIGGALGIGLGAVILRLAPSAIPQGLLPEAVSLTFDMRIVAFCAGAAVVVGLLFGLAPAWQATEFSSSNVIGSDSRTATGRGGKIRNLLVAAEVATAVLLLFGAGLLLRTLLAVDGIDKGYRADGALTMMVDPLGARYPTEASLLQFYDALEREISAVPGVGSVAWASTLPLGPSVFGRTFFGIVGEAPVPESKRPTADYQIVSPAYFSTLDLPIVSGRAFTAHDTRASVPVCIVNEAFVRGYLHGRSPIGAKVAIRDSASEQAPSTIREIVGVARQVKERPDEKEDLVQLYVPMAQEPIDDIYLVVRPASGRPEALTSSVRAAIGRIDREQLVSVRDIMTLDDVASEATSRHRFRAVMVVTFAGLALVLAMVGVFGILAYSVQQRGRDFGVRRALGATTQDVLRLVVASAVRVIALGTIAGLALSAALGRMLSTVLFGVQPLDPWTFASVTIVLAIAALLSAAGPAWRATRIDPATALRTD
jgi:putative ABC transport system permease protein